MPGTPTARVTCPICGFNRIVKRTGTNAAMSGKLTAVKGIFHFGGFPLKKDFPLVRWFLSMGRASKADALAGLKQSGWKMVESMTIEQAISDPAWSWVVDDLYRRSNEIIERIDHARKRK